MNRCECAINGRFYIYLYVAIGSWWVDDFRKKASQFTCLKLLIVEFAYFSFGHQIENVSMMQVFQILLQIIGKK